MKRNTTAIRAAVGIRPIPVPRALWILITLTAGITSLSHAQDGPPSARPTMLPGPAPLLAPRPYEGQTPGQRWQLERRGGDDTAPIGQYFQSLQGSDATVELVVGQARLLTTREPIVKDGTPIVATGDATIFDFDVLPDGRTIRLVGRRPGVTDLSITTGKNQTYVLEVHVGYDVALLGTQLRKLFPDTTIQLSQIRGTLVMEGQVRNIQQSAAIEQAVKLILTTGLVSSGQPSGMGSSGAPNSGNQANASGSNAGTQGSDGAPSREDGEASAEVDEPRGDEVPTPPSGAQSAGSAIQPQVINLLRVPGIQQVMLHVKIGELNRTALREMGADWFFEWGAGNKIGTTIAGAQQSLTGFQGLGTSATAFGIFPSAHVNLILRALRDNSLLTLLAEPNVVALNGQRASFLAGGQYPVPVPQMGGVGGMGNTIQFKDFGVQLHFVPTILDEETIRLQVSPEVSTIDRALGTVLVVGGTEVPGLSTRKVDTTVELRQGHTLALAGLLQVDLDARTRRIPFLGDLPYLGPFFSNTSHKRVEKELLVMVTPYLIEPMTPDQVPCLPGADVADPTDGEFFAYGMIEGKGGMGGPCNGAACGPTRFRHVLLQDRRFTYGPTGFSE